MKCNFLKEVAFTLLIVFSLILNTTAQEYGNEWIDYNKTYYKVAINQTGIYRVTFEQLNAVGFPSNISTNKLQAFFRGQEQAIHVGGGSDSFFGPGDYIEFYGKRNDGTLDAFMYQKPEYQTNPYRNIYSDFTYVFLTIASDGKTGKRMANASAFGGSPITFYREEIVRHFTNSFALGQQYPESDTRFDSGGYNSDWINGKGYTGPLSSGNSASKRDYVFNISDLYQTSFVASFDITMTGRSNTVHNVDILAGPSPDNQRVIQNLLFNNFDNIRISSPLNQSDFDLENNRVYISYKVNPRIGNGSNERVAVSVIKLNHLRNFNANGAANKAFTLNNSISNNTASFTISEVGDNARLYDISDENSIRMVNSSVSDSTLTASLGGARGLTKLWINTTTFSSNEIQQITIDKPKEGSNYLMVIGEQFTQASQGEDNVAQSFADYRESQQGGAYVVDLQKFSNLRNLFSYGEYSPLAIRRYAKYMLTQGTPKFLFLVGKSLDISYQYERTKSNGSFIYPESFPCWGAPCSDNLYTANISNDINIYEPLLATGRLSSIFPAALSNYLNKLKEHESITQPQEWQKRALHLSGGKNNNELTGFRGFVDFYKNIIEGKYLGASVSTASKRTTSELEFIDVVDQVNEGLGLITFFGHSSIVTTDITIGKVSNPVLGYSNKGRYPFLLINGCLTGNVYDKNNATIGEDWVTSASRGAIGYIAHSDLGYSLNQHYFTTEFYRTHFQDSDFINAPIGSVIKEVVKRNLANRSTDKLTWAHAQQYVLQGDPAVRLYPTDKADYEITDESISAETFFGVPLSVLADSFRIAIDVKNLGIVDEKDFDVSILRTFSDGSTRRYSPSFYRAIKNEETIYFVIRNSVQDKLKSPGINSFEIFIDYSENVEEAREDNNYARIELVFPKGGTDIITPKEFSILNQQPINIIVQNKNLLDKPRSFLFEIDTTDLYNSPIKKDTLIFSGLTPSWQTSLLTDNNLDSTVYYVRSRYAQIDTEEDSTWAESSFIYIKDGPEGWSQSHFPQYKKNELVKIERDDNKRELNFIEEFNELVVTSVGSGVSDRNSYKVTYNNVDIVSNGQCFTNRLLMVKFNRDTGVPYSEDYVAITTPLSCGLGTPGAATWLDVGVINRFNGINRVINDSNTGDPMLFMAGGGFSYHGMANAQWEAFARIGADVEKMRETLENGDPFILFGKVGLAAGQAEMVFPDKTPGAIASNAQTLVGNFGIQVDNTTGTMTSTLIGPAINWGSIHYNFGSKDNANELNDISINVVDRNGNEGLILNKVPNTNYDLSWINPDIYPYIKLRTTFSDPVNNTPTQLNKWQVYYKEAPEGILFYQANQDVNLGNPDSLSISLGARTNFAFKFQNVSNGSFTDPIIAEYQLRNLASNVTKTYYDTLQPLAIGDSILFNVQVPTKEMEGKNRLRVFVNPRIQAEQIYENNIIEVEFNIVPDNANPILDVVFDGIHIMDGEIVSPTPIITVSLTDENKFLIRNDTSGINLFLAKCESCSIDDIKIGDQQSEFERIHFSDTRVSWVSNENNEFEIFFQPELEDGKYVFAAQGEDLSGNNSGIKPYRVRFEVINESSITNFYPYPNPFSDNVRFVFTLTGSEIPNELKIQIMTVSGRVVREITQDELGVIRAGNNISEYAWDGKDEFGDQLANGVYLYRVIIPKNDDMFEHRETEGDNLFKNGFGKLYLLK